MTPASVLSRSWLLAFAMLLPASTAWGYRPFVSTDAAVADPKELEIELGYFNLERSGGKRTFIVPKVILNYGIVRNLEVVGEFEAAKPPDRGAQLVDPGVFLKAVLKEGILQDQEGSGVAVEIGPLLPSTVQGERRLGFEGIGILSGRFIPFTYHVNLGGGVDRAEANPFVIWGLIVELPVFPRFRLVGEVNGESARGRPADNSGLVGFIWQPSPSSPFLDAGIRHGFSAGAPDWLFTMGLTFGFPIRP
ncbi:MAG: hypothetical protein KGL31_12735 [candidate division NC10 bacterium]|nr:hypothetical protein [candidate division NC10 bacterium]MDE2322755.1 hypothetical protein [candidate division NC10 bacterium]